MRYIFFILLCITFNNQLKAQKSCDNLYSKAIHFQQTMSIASQNQAIVYFQKAQACYDSAAKKKLCSSQIATCKNTIALIKKKNSDSNAIHKRKTVETTTVDSLTKTEEQTPVKKEEIKVELFVNETVVKFKPKGGEFKKVKVTCNQDDWKVIEHPDWIIVSVNKDNEIVLESTKNMLSKERSGMIIIDCHGTQTSFAILQSKKGILGKIGF